MPKRRNPAPTKKRTLNQVTKSKSPAKDHPRSASTQKLLKKENTSSKLSSKVKDLIAQVQASSQEESKAAKPAKPPSALHKWTNQTHDQKAQAMDKK
jgi:hypothetical protein